MGPSRCGGKTLEFSIGNRRVRCGDDIDGREYLCSSCRLEYLEDRVQNLEVEKRERERWKNKVDQRLRDLSIRIDRAVNDARRRGW